MHVTLRLLSSRVSRIISLCHLNHDQLIAHKCTPEAAEFLLEAIRGFIWNALLPPLFEVYTIYQIEPLPKTMQDHIKKDIPGDCMRVLTEVFGHSHFKGKQKEIVEAAYEGADVLVVAPTGLGKSLCFQIPAIADQHGVSLVVSPLLALMQNQIDNLRLKDVEVAALSSHVSTSEQDKICKKLQLYDTPLRLLYVTPEKLSTPNFQDLLNVVHENHNLNRLVVDEAHCISEWGHDFRADYRRIGNFRNRYPNVPIMALTATATAVVQNDIIKSLKLDHSRLFTALHPFNRENLFYEVRYLSNPKPLDQMTEMFEYITGLYRRRGQASSGIIYCRFRKTCDEVSKYLRDKGINARAYHRGLPSATLEKTMKGWTTGEGVDVVVATIAFGLGIDKGDVRYILHYDLPKSFEGYYQETGRAGRDGNPAKCILYYSREDVIRVKRFVRSSDPNRVRQDEDDGPTPTQRASGSLEALINYAESTTTCRHVAICQYFGEHIDEGNAEVVKTYCDRMCDICRHPEKTRDRIRNLSSKQNAAANVPFSNSSYVNSTIAAPPGRQMAYNPQGIDNASGGQPSRGPFVAQKRPFSSDSTESSTMATKKPKVAFPPLLVTKPFGSASSLSKPFKAPSFVRPVGDAASPRPQQQSSAPKKPLSERRNSNSPNNVPPPKPAKKPNAPPPLTTDIEGAESDDQIEEPSPSLELPKVGLVWEVDHSAKISTFEREKAFQALRRSLHRVLVIGNSVDDAWSAILDGLLSDGKRNEVIFKTAADLEILAISLSSTREGYHNRIEATRCDIKKLGDVSLWDSKDGDFEDSQEIIDVLRRCALRYMNKGKGRAK